MPNLLPPSKSCAVTARDKGKSMQPWHPIRVQRMKMTMTKQVKKLAVKKCHMHQGFLSTKVKTITAKTESLNLFLPSSLVNESSPIIPVEKGKNLLT